MTPFTGVWPALVTPLTAEGEIDAPAAERLIEALIAAGAAGLYVCGGTGEGVLLGSARRRRMAEVAIGAVAGRIPVMVHIGAITTAESVALASHATAAGADAVSAVPPFYFAYPFAAVKEHYRAIAAASGVPVYLYYIPGATGGAVSVPQLLELCALEGVAGLKYTSQDLYFLSRLLAERDPGRVNVLSGPDELFLPCLSMGVEGCIGTTYNFMPRLYIDIWQTYLRGEVAQARVLQKAGSDVIAVLIRHSVLPATKALLGLLGFPVGHGVLPMPPVVGDALEALRRDLAAVGLWDLVHRPALYGPAGDPMRGTLA
ncbi:MAG: dihydrodipicolinate synthase family protein [Chloroflexota bacterium]